MKMNVKFAETTQAFEADMGEIQRVTVGNVEISLEETTDGVLITAKDADGVETVLVRHGKNGKDGKTPVKGEDYKDGEPGEPGRTPVAGVDYYTEADKADMVQAVLAALPVYGGEVE